MNTPIIFLDSQRELRSLQDLAAEQFSDFYRLQETAGAPAPTVEDVYPRLTHFARQLGCTAQCPLVFQAYSDNDLSEKISQVRWFVDQVFTAYPHLVRNLLVMPEPRKENHLPAPLNFPDEPMALPSIGSSLSPRLSQFIPNTTISSATAKAEGRGKVRDIAYAVTQELLARVKIKILGEAIYSYTGHFYQHITAENLRRLIMALCRSQVESEGNSRLVEEVYRLLMVEPTICEKPEQISSYLVSFTNGVLDLKTGQLHPHAPRFNTYYEIDAKYTAYSQAHPVFDKFVMSLTGGDPVMALRILEVIGYCLVPDTKGKVFFVFQGVPDSGKSVLAAFIRGCFNNDATVAMDILSLGERFAASSLIGKQLCTSMDLPSTALSSKAVSTFKQLTGGDPLTTDVKYAAHITFYNTAKFIFGSNHLLLTQNSDPAFYRRAVVLPFSYTIPKEQQDFYLLEKLNQERSAIVYDAIEAYLALRARNYVFSGNYILNEVIESESQNTSPSVEALLCQFIREFCVVGDEYEAFVDDLYQGFVYNFGANSLAYDQFSSALLAACTSMGVHCVRRTQKKRKPGCKNPLAHLAGIALRGSIALEAAA